MKIDISIELSVGLKTDHPSSFSFCCLLYQILLLIVLIFQLLNLVHFLVKNESNELREVSLGLFLPLLLLNCMLIYSSILILSVLVASHLILISLLLRPFLNIIEGHLRFEFLLNILNSF